MYTVLCTLCGGQGEHKATGRHGRQSSATLYPCTEDVKGGCKVAYTCSESASYHQVGEGRKSEHWLQINLPLLPNNYPDNCRMQATLHCHISLTLHWRACQWLLWWHSWPSLLPQVPESSCPASRPSSQEACTERDCPVWYTQQWSGVRTLNRPLSLSILEDHLKGCFNKVFWL